MRLEEIILKHLQELPGPEKAEVLNFTPLLHKDAVESTAYPRQKAVSTFLPPAQREDNFQRSLLV